MATGARIVPRFENLNEKKLGFAGRIEELSFGTTQCNMIIVKEPKETDSVTVLIRGGSATIVEETQRSLHDALSPSESTQTRSYPWNNTPFEDSPMLWSRF